ncbi:hypothetical protein HQ529_00610 [Candidatus Woesearchaeota archaeon]|nr:hypothetical protein [Candidatus Woesearchaeota archaeon]
MVDEEEEKKRLVGKKRFILKEVFDRIGYGFTSQQFINIFLLQTGASYFLIGILTGLKNFLSVFTSSVLQGYSKKPETAKRIVVFSGILLALVFFGLAYTKSIYSLLFFSILLLLSGIITPFYGDLYSNFSLSLDVKKTKIVKRLTQYGLILTAISLLAAGYVLDMKKDGYIHVLIIASVSFLFSTITLLVYNKSTKQVFMESTLITQIERYFTNIKESLSLFTENKIHMVLLVASIVVVFVQTLGNAYYGVFIYENLTYGLGRYMNVALVFVLAVLASVIGPYVSQKNAVEYGKFPMLVFGTLLMAIMPLTFYYNPNIVSISMGVIIGTIGAAINGTAHGMLAMEITPESKRKSYLSTIGFIVTILSLILIPSGSYIAQIYGLRNLFLFLGLLMVVVVVPLYFIVVVLQHKKKL